MNAVALFPQFDTQMHAIFDDELIYAE